MLTLVLALVLPPQQEQEQALELVSPPLAQVPVPVRVPVRVRVPVQGLLPVQAVPVLLSPQRRGAGWVQLVPVVLLALGTTTVPLPLPLPSLRPKTPKWEGQAKTVTLTWCSHGVEQGLWFSCTLLCERAKPCVRH